jgi:hypothetical protein
LINYKKSSNNPDKDWDFLLSHDKLENSLI